MTFILGTILFAFLMAFLQVNARRQNYIFIRNRKYYTYHLAVIPICVLIILGIHYIRLDVFKMLYLGGCTYWIFYDISDNLLSGKKILYVGSGGIDMILGKWQYLIKLLILIMLICYEKI